MAGKLPAPPQKDWREVLQELANANTLKTARNGFRALDELANRAKKALKEYGVDGADEAIDKLNTSLKKSAAEAITGRRQP